MHSEKLTVSPIYGFAQWMRLAQCQAAEVVVGGVGAAEAPQMPVLVIRRVTVLVTRVTVLVTRVTVLVRWIWPPCWQKPGKIVRKGGIMIMS